MQGGKPPVHPRSGWADGPAKNRRDVESSARKNFHFGGSFAIHPFLFFQRFAPLRFILIFCGVYLFPVFFSLPCSFLHFSFFPPWSQCDVERIYIAPKPKRLWLKLGSRGGWSGRPSGSFQNSRKQNHHWLPVSRYQPFLSSATTPPLFILLYIEF